MKYKEYQHVVSGERVTWTQDAYRSVGVVGPKALLVKLVYLFFEGKLVYYQNLWLFTMTFFTSRYIIVGLSYNGRSSSI